MVASSYFGLPEVTNFGSFGLPEDANFGSFELPEVAKIRLFKCCHNWLVTYLRWVHVIKAQLPKHLFRSKNVIVRYLIPAGSRAKL